MPDQAEPLRRKVAAAKALGYRPCETCAGTGKRHVLTSRERMADAAPGVASIVETWEATKCDVCEGKGVTFPLDADART